MGAFNERQIRLVHELMYNIKVGEVMTNNVISFPSTTTFREIQRCMKEKRFSGAPIVDDGELVGIVSIDDIITAFDRGTIDEPVAEYMTRELTTIPQNYSVIAASNIFSKHRFGRLPVVEVPKGRKLVGILTFGDILSHLLVKMNTIAERIQEQEQSLENVVKNARDHLHFELKADNFDLAGMASTTIKKHLQANGIPAAVVRRIAVICYEAEINVIIHSLGGYMDVHIFDDRVQLHIVDDGPGIPDLEKALEPGYTTANEKIRALGFGAGMGLANMKRCADEFAIQSSMETGTEINAVVYSTKENQEAPNETQ